MISILMPTFNDAESIADSIQSALQQQGVDFELIVIDDGSTDETPAVVQSFQDPRLRYFRRENGDQLNALLTGSDHIVGNFVTLLHSDDRYAEPSSLQKCRARLQQHPEAQGVFADIIKIDESGNERGRLIASIPDHKEIYAKAYLSGASNTLFDVFFVRRKYFEQQVRRNYLTDNSIYYLNSESISEIPLIQTDPFYQYRIHEGNYAESPVGKFVLYNGRFRTIFKLLKSGIQPRAKWIYRLGSSRKWLNRLYPSGLLSSYQGTTDWEWGAEYFRTWKSEIDGLRVALLTRQLEKMIHSYESRLMKSPKRPLVFTESDFLDWSSFDGKDARLFFRAHEAQRLPTVFTRLLEEDYDSVQIQNAEQKMRIESALHFFSFAYELRHA